MNRMVTTPSDAVSGLDFQTSSRADSDRAFRGARRHSRNVRLLRILVPAGVVGSILLISAMTYISSGRLSYKLPNDMGTLVVSGTKITMELPRLAGYTKDHRGYEVTAKAAAQDLAKPDFVELTDLRAKLAMQDNNSAELVTIGGLYNTKTEILNLGPNILLTSTNGYEARLADAVVEVKKGNITSDKPVEVKMARGTLNANRLEVINSGEIIRFEGGVVMHLNPEQPASDKGASAKDTAKQAVAR
jgi:lipopolysaccharide export system protein LptC